MCCLPPLFFDALDCVGSSQTEHTPPKFQYTVPNMIIEEIHFGLLLGLFVDQVAVLMYFHHQSIVPGAPHRIVDIEAVGVHGLEDA